MSREKTTKISVIVSNDTLAGLDAMAKAKHLTRADIMRNILDKGIQVNFIENSEGLVRRIVHEEVTESMAHGVERLAKLNAKSAKASASALYLLLLLISDDYADEETTEELLANAFTKAAKYLRATEKPHTEYLAEAKGFLNDALGLRKRSDE